MFIHQYDFSCCLGFGDGEEYPFDQDNGTKGQIDNQCESLEFACSSFGNGSFGRDCVPNSYLCDGGDDCQDGSDEQLDFCGKCPDIVPQIIGCKNL